MRSLLAISFNQKPKNLSCKSVNLESPLAIPFYRLLDVALPDGRVQNFSFSLFFLFFLLFQNPLRFETVILCYYSPWFFLRLQSCWNVLRTPPVMIEKAYMQWFMIICHACIRTWFWNIGPHPLLLVRETPSCLSLLLKPYAGFISRVVSDFLRVVLFPKCMTCHCLFVMLLSNVLAWFSNL